MRTSIFLLLFFLGCIACKKDSSEPIVCQNCDPKTDGIEVLQEKIGWIIFDEKYKKYGIQVDRFDDALVYLPCQVPAYFQTQELATVVFSGTVIEDPYTFSKTIKTTYYCIKLDTLYMLTSK